MSGAADHKHMGPASGPSLAATVLVDLVKRVDVLQLDGHHRLAALRLIDSQSVSTTTFAAEMRLRGDMPARGDACAHAKGGVNLCMRSSRTVFEFDRLCFVSSLSGAANRVGAVSGPGLAANELESTSTELENLPNLVSDSILNNQIKWQLRGDMPARGDACAHANGGVDPCMRSSRTVFDFDRP